MTIKQLLEMPVGEKIGGGFVLTIKKTKKEVLLNGYYTHSVVLFDETGEMLADFKDPGGKGARNPMIKGWEVKIIVAEIQAAEPTKSGEAVKKLYVDQFSVVTANVADQKVGYEPGDDYPDWRVTVRGKIRHGLVCSYIKAGKEIDKTKIEKLIEYIMEGE